MNFNFKNYQFLKAVFEDNIDEVKTLLENGEVNIDFQDKNFHENTALHIAAEKNNFDMTKLLIENSANQKLKNCFGKTAVELAKNIKVLNLFTNIVPLDSNASANESDLQMVVPDPKPIGGNMKSFLHGTTYQQKMILFTLINGLQDDNKEDFCMATEMGDAEKFDDLVYISIDPNASITDLKNVKFNFFQGKHSRDGKKKVNFASLCSDDEKEKFSLKKYFISFRMISRMYSHFTLENFIACTNIKLDINDLKKNGIEVKDHGKDLCFDTEEFRKFKINAKENDQNYRLFDSLRKGSDFHILAKALVFHIVKGNKLNLGTSIFLLYHTALFDYGILERQDEENALFSIKFLKKEVQGHVLEFYETFIQEYERKHGRKIADLSGKRLKISHSFGKHFTKPSQLPTKEESEAMAEEILRLINSCKKGEKVITYKKSIVERKGTITDGVIEKLSGTAFFYSTNENTLKFSLTFLTNPTPELLFFNQCLKDKFKKDNLIFLCYYEFKITTPYMSCFEYVKPLTNFVVTDIAKEAALFFEKFVYLNTPNGDVIENLLSKRLSVQLQYFDNDFARSYMSADILNWMKQKGGSYIDKKYARSLKETILQKLNVLKYVGLNSRFCKVIESYNIEYNWFPPALLEYLNNSNNKVFYLKSNHILGAIKVFKALKTLPEYQMHDSYVFDDVQDLLKEVDELELAFQSTKSINLIVIVCKNHTVQNISSLIDSLIQILNDYNHKKLILIGDLIDINIPEDNLTTHIDANQFSYFSIPTQKMLLEKEVIFLGNPSKLETILKNNVDLLDDETLANLIENKKIEVGRPFTHSVGYDAAYYISRLLIYKKDDTEIIEDEMFLLNFSEKTTIIADVAGMGKSTFLTKTALEVSDKWVIRIDISSFRELLKENPTVASLYENMIEKDLTTAFEKRLFNFLLENGDVLIVVDGYDEAEYYESVDEFLKFIQQKQAFLWVSTRTEFKEKLENLLNIGSYSLKLFEKSGQKNFLFKLWKKRCRVHLSNQQEDQLRKFTKEVIQKFRKFFEECESFIGIPLQLFMVATIFQDLCFKYLEQETHYEPALPDELMNLEEFYERFVGQIISLYEKEKSQKWAKDVRDTYKEKVYENHGLIALQTLLDEKHLNCLLDVEKKDKLNNVLTDLNINNIGITYFVQNVLRFTHLTYAEYFAAIFLMNKVGYKRGAVYKCIEYIIIKSSPVFVECIANLISTKETLNGITVLNFAVENNYINCMKRFMPHKMNYPEPDVNNRTPLHYAAKNGNKDIVVYLLGRLYELMGGLILPKLRQYIMIADKDGKNAIEYAQEGKTEKHVNVFMLLNAVKHINEKLFPKYKLDKTQNEIEELKNIRIGYKFNFRYGCIELLSYFCAYEELKTIELFLESIENEDKKFYNSSTVFDKIVESELTETEKSDKINVLLKQKYISKEELCYRVIKANKIGLLKNLIRTEENQPNFYWFCFQKASMYRKNEIIKYLYEKAKFDLESRTPLHIMFKGNVSGKLITELINLNDLDLNKLDYKHETPIFEAVRKGYSAEIIEFLINKGVVYTHRNNQNETLLDIAISCEHDHLVKLLLPECKAVKNAKCAEVMRKFYENRLTCNNEGNNFLLHNAIADKNLPLIKFLIKNGADINTKNENNQTPLQIAAENNICVEFLLENGAIFNPDNILIRGDKKTTRLIDIINNIFNKPSTSKQFQNRFMACIYITKNDKSQTLLHIMTEKKDYFLVHCLLSAARFFNNIMPKFINQKDANGQFPLSIAVRNGNFNIVEDLLLHGAYFDVLQDQEIENCENNDIKDLLQDIKKLFDAVSSNDEVTFNQKIALFNELFINVKDKNDKTILYHAMENNNFNAMKLLLNKGALFDLSKSSNASQHFCKSFVNKVHDLFEDLENYASDEEIIDCIEKISKKYEISVYFIGKIENKKRYTCMEYTMLTKKPDIFKYLLENGDVYNRRKNNCLVHLTSAAIQGMLMLVEAIFDDVENNKEINVTEADYKLITHVRRERCVNFDEIIETLLHTAARNGNLKAVQWLIEKNAEIDVEDSSGKTALKIAEECNHKDIEEYLKNQEMEIPYKKSKISHS